MDAHDFQGVTTLIAMLAYGGICWWAYSARNRRRFEEDAMLPFDDEREQETSSTGDRER